MIQAVVALLTGQSFGVGQMLPMGYDVYNVPYAYRDQYYDTNDMWYRYDDGYIYGIDPYSRMIQDVYPVSYGGYAVGYPAPTYASYGYPSYAVPYGYDNLYYGAPGYNYQYANGGIYQVDPTTQMISALVALVTGQNLGIGQMLPLGYDAYNVPYAYRSSYYDTPNTIYRYDDGYIYGANPRTRVIQTAVPVAYNGFAVGYPVPADYPGYAVRRSTATSITPSRDLTIATPTAASTRSIRRPGWWRRSRRSLPDSPSVSARCCRRATMRTMCPTPIAASISTRRTIGTAMPTATSTRSTRKPGSSRP